MRFSRFSRGVWLAASLLTSLGSQPGNVHPCSSKEICLRCSLRGRTTNRQRLGQRPRRKPIKPDIILFGMHPPLHLLMETAHLFQRQKAFKHALLHPPPMPLQKLSQPIAPTIIRNVVNHESHHELTWSRRQKAEGRRQKAEGRRQKAEGIRQKWMILAIMSPAERAHSGCRFRGIAYSAAIAAQSPVGKAPPGCCQDAAPRS